MNELPEVDSSIISALSRRRLRPGKGERPDGPDMVGAATRRRREREGCCGGVVAACLVSTVRRAVEYDTIPVVAYTYRAIASSSAPVSYFFYDTRLALASASVMMTRTTD